MTWLVFGVSCLLVLAGAVSIISGAPIIQLERGWAEVISGTVALSSGGVVFALALVLMRLENLRETLAAQAEAAFADPARVHPALPATAAEPAAVAADLRAEQAPEPPAPPPLPPPESEAPVSTPAPPAAEHGLWKRIRRPAEQPAADQFEQGGFPDRIVPEEASASSMPPTSAPVIVPPHPTTHAPDVEPTVPAPDTATPADAGQIGWLERSLLRGRAARQAEPGSPPLFGDPAPDGDGRREPSLGATPALASTPTSRPAAIPPEPALEPEPTPDLAAERHDGVSVIGRYQAGSSSYVMFSDGTIEVETEDGQVHRFGSMDELKAYIASEGTAAT